MRPSRDQYFLNLASVVSSRATCSRLSVGAVIVSSEGHVIATGYNGAPQGVWHFVHADGEGSCQTAVHAEANAIVQAARAGHATRNAKMYCTHKPCLGCLNLCINAGIFQIVYADDYRPDPRVSEVAQEAGVFLRKVVKDAVT